MSSRRERGFWSHENTLVIIMFFAAGIVFLDRFGIAYAFPYIGPDLDLNNAQLGLTMSITAVTWAISSIIFSFISDYFGGKKKLIIVTSIVLFSIATGLIGLASSFAALMVIRGIIGAVEGPALPLIQSAVAGASSPHRRGRNLGIVIAGTSLIGAALPPILVVGLAEAFGWRAVFLFLAVPGLLIALLVARFMRESDSRAAEGPEMTRPSMGDIRRALANRNVLLSLVGSAAMIGFVLGFVSFAPLFLTNTTDLSPAQVGLTLTLFGLVGAAGTIIAPSVSDRIGRKPAFIIAAACVALVPIAFILFGNNLPMLLACLVLQLMAGGALTLVTYVIPGESVPASLMATTFAVLIAAGELVGGAVGPAFGGVLADAYGLGAALWFCSGLGVLAFLVGLAVKETLPTRRRQEETVPPIVVGGEGPLA